MSRRRAVAAVVTLAVLLGIRALWGPVAPVQAQVVLPPAQQPLGHVSGDRALAKLPAWAPRADDAPNHAGEEATRAAVHYAEEGWIRCSLPASFGKVQTGNPHWETQEGDVLSLAVFQPTGFLAVYRADVPRAPKLEDIWHSDEPPTDDELDDLQDELQELTEAWYWNVGAPVGLIEWTGATPDNQGVCVVTPTGRPVDITVVLQTAGGQPVPDAVLSASPIVRPGHSMGSKSRVTLRLPEFATLHVYPHSYSGYDSDVRTVIARAGQVEVFEAIATVALSSAEQLDGMESEHTELTRRIELSVEALEAALDNPNLSEAARVHLERWLEQEVDELHEKLRDNALAEQLAQDLIDAETDIEAGEAIDPEQLEQPQDDTRHCPNGDTGRVCHEDDTGGADTGAGDTGD